MKVRNALNANSKGGVVINRKLGQAIIIGDNIRITLVGFRSNNEIKLLIEAPMDLTITREKGYETKILKFIGSFEENAELIDNFRKENNCERDEDKREGFWR